mmetsp:Transcript_99956/g.278355  ORF Transcript_99956/g.278355 Transcript_99956/m.278355 type:complete len:292 (-) Transcript_99956:15-890(-)
MRRRRLGLDAGGPLRLPAVDGGPGSAARELGGPGVALPAAGQQEGPGASGGHMLWFGPCLRRSQAHRAPAAGAGRGGRRHPRRGKGGGVAGGDPAALAAGGGQCGAGPGVRRVHGAAGCQPGERPRAAAEQPVQAPAPGFRSRGLRRPGAFSPDKCRPNAAAAGLGRRGGVCPPLLPQRFGHQPTRRQGLAGSAQPSPPCAEGGGRRLRGQSARGQPVDGRPRPARRWRLRGGSFSFRRLGRPMGNSAAAWAQRAGARSSQQQRRWHSRLSVWSDCAQGFAFCSLQPLPWA